MATIEEALYSRLSTYPEVVKLASTRIYPLVIPQDSDLPAMAYQRISGMRELEHGGPSGFASGRFQVTCTAATYAAAVGLANAVRRGLEGYRGETGGVTVEACSTEGQYDGYNEMGDTFTVRVDFEVMYRE